ncbi:hypothetical protein WMY93_005863 [Mugilogobius chulae]|uniref:Uncharacterized protein n=1 Tax=Mugilogobius chulae TaxID=88201 RepID=A0AAW0PI14_9GOBI
MEKINKNTRLWSTTTILSLMSKVTDLREVGIGVSLCGSMEETDLFFWRKSVKYQIIERRKFNPETRSKEIKQQLLFDDTKAVLLLPVSCSCPKEAPATDLLLPEVESCARFKDINLLHKSAPATDLILPESYSCRKFNPESRSRDIKQQFFAQWHKNSAPGTDLLLPQFASATVQLLPDSCSGNSSTPARNLPPSISCYSSALATVLPSSAFSTSWTTSDFMTMDSTDDKMANLSTLMLLLSCSCHSLTCAKDLKSQMSLELAFLSVFCARSVSSSGSCARSVSSSGSCARSVSSSGSCVCSVSSSGSCVCSVSSCGPPVAPVSAVSPPVAPVSAVSPPVALQWLLCLQCLLLWHLHLCQSSEVEILLVESLDQASAIVKDSHRAEMLRDLEDVTMAVFVIRTEVHCLEEPPVDIGVVIEGVEVLNAALRTVVSSDMMMQWCLSGLCLVPQQNNSTTSSSDRALKACAPPFENYKRHGSGLRVVLPPPPPNPSDDFFGGSEDHLEEDDPTLSLDDLEAGELDVCELEAGELEVCELDAGELEVCSPLLSLRHSPVLTSSEDVSDTDEEDSEDEYIFPLQSPNRRAFLDEPLPLVLVGPGSSSPPPPETSDLDNSPLRPGLPSREEDEDSETSDLDNSPLRPGLPSREEGEDSETSDLDNSPLRPVLPSREEDEDSETSDLDNSPLRRGRRPREEDEDEEEEPSSRRPRLSDEDEPSTWVPPLPTPSTLYGAAVDGPYPYGVFRNYFHYYI